MQYNFKVNVTTDKMTKKKKSLFKIISPLSYTNYKLRLNRRVTRAGNKIAYIIFFPSQCLIVPHANADPC